MTITVSHTFAPTLNRDITGIAIKFQPTELSYTEGDPLNLTGLVITMNFNSGSPVDVLYSKTSFETYNISTVPAHDIPLTLIHNEQPITVIAGDHTLHTVELKVFEAVAKVGNRSYQTLKAAITAAANDTSDNTTEIIILRNITAHEGYTIPNGKNIKLTVESGKSFTITASA